FQAEDGIRDRNVTGVQTCALPIYVIKSPLRRRFEKRIGGEPDRFAHGNASQALSVIGSAAKISLSVLLRDQVLQALFDDLVVGRSEERRVGKEGRLWVWQEQQKEE